MELAHKVLALWVENLVLMGSWAWIDPLGGFLIQILFGDGPHRPLWGLVVSVLVIVSWAWELDPVQLDVTPRSCFLGKISITPRPMWHELPLLWPMFVSTKRSIL